MTSSAALSTVRVSIFEKLHLSATVEMKSGFETIIFYPFCPDSAQYAECVLRCQFYETSADGNGCCYLLKNNGYVIMRVNSIYTAFVRRRSSFRFFSRSTSRLQIISYGFSGGGVMKSDEVVRFLIFRVTVRVTVVTTL